MIDTLKKALVMSFLVTFPFAIILGSAAAAVMFISCVAILTTALILENRE